jgi:hypothetical protein
VAVRHRARTQTEAYWQRDFKLRAEDLEAIYDLLLEDGKPRSLDDLVCEVMARHCRREAQARRPAEARLYRPIEHYDEGQQLVFPNLDYAIGKVVAVRPGQNPRYGEFSVITVALEGQEATRDFAADFQFPHPLNELNQEAPAGEDGELSVEELCARYGEPVREALGKALSENPEFVPYDGHWFLRGLLPEVHVGHLNLAEAVIDVAGHPLTTTEILQQVELDAESRPQARAFALNLALEQDDRFDNVGSAANPRWFLYNLEPPAVASKPSWLQADYRATGDELVHRQSLEIAEELGDELDELAEPGVVARSLESGRAGFVLNFPHRRSGTFPLTREILALFPRGEYTRIPIRIIDERTDASWMGWVLPQEGYGWGLGEWYENEGVPAGATVELLMSRDPYSVVVRCDRRSRRTEWARVPSVENNRLTFEIRKRAYTCRYDRNLLIGEPTDTTRLDQLREHYREQPMPLMRAIMLVFPELAKLGSQGFVNAKALYAALNVPWRSGAIPILAELARHACFDPVGDGNWAFDDSLVDVLYTTPEEMEMRPRSRRDDLIRERVLRYGDRSL